MTKQELLDELGFKTETRETIKISGGRVWLGPGKWSTAGLLIHEGRVIEDRYAWERDHPEHEDVMELRLDDSDIVCPGIIDIHVHTFGALAFAVPDSVGVFLGSTVVGDAGGAGIDTWSEFDDSVVKTAATRVLSWLYINRAGIFDSLIGHEDEAAPERILGSVDVERFVDVARQRRGQILGVKLPLVGRTTDASLLRIAKGLAELCSLRLYVHIGDHLGALSSNSPAIIKNLGDCLDILDGGDVVTHMFTGNPANLLDSNGKLMDAAVRARERGVAFDVGFGGYNFDFGTARAVVDAGLIPDTISSDLQQVNITGPTYSLMYVMSCIAALGFSLDEILERVTSGPRAMLGMGADMSVELSSGAPCNLSVIRASGSDIEVRDTGGKVARSAIDFAPVCTIVGLNVYWANQEAAALPLNWSWKEARRRVTLGQRTPVFDHGIVSEVVTALEALGDEEWRGPVLSEVLRSTGASRDEGCWAVGREVLGALMDPVFPLAAGYFLASQAREGIIRALKTALSSC